MRVGLIDVLDALEDDNSDELQTQLKVTRMDLVRKMKLTVSSSSVLKPEQNLFCQSAISVFDFTLPRLLDTDRYCTESEFDLNLNNYSEHLMIGDERDDFFRNC